MTDKKKPTWEVVNPDGDYVIVRGYREAMAIAKDENEFIGCPECLARLGVYDRCYWVRRGQPMTDAKLKSLPELDSF